MTASLAELSAARVLVLDGAMGSWLEPGGRNSDRLVLSDPARVRDAHARYLAAGADIIETNTFNSNALSQADYGADAQSYELNLAAARLAKTVAAEWTQRTPAQPRLVAGALGPSTRKLGAVGRDAWHEAYAEQARGLADGGVDLLLIETLFDLAHAAVCIEAVAEARGNLPLWISFTLGPGGRLASGESPAELWSRLQAWQPAVIGINCSFGAHSLAPALEQLSGSVPILTAAHPSAGLPEARGTYPEPPEKWAELVAELAERRLANIVGGCCGTTPEHIAQLARAVRGLPSRSG